MAIVSLNDTRSRVDYFRQGILTNLQYWHSWLPGKITDVEALDGEQDRIIRAIRFALSLEEIAWASVQELIVTFSPYMERRGHWLIWNQVLRQAIEVAQYREDVSGAANLSALLARLLRRQSRFEESTTYYRRAIQLSRQLGDEFGEARACTNLGFYYTEQGYWHRAEVLCCHALKIFERLENNHGRAHTENHLGLLYTRRGSWDKARYHLVQACMIWQSSGDEHGLMHGYTNLSVLFNEMQHPDETLSYAEKALTKATLAGEEINIGTIYMNMGVAYRLKGMLAEAETYSWRAEAIFRHYSHVLGLAHVRENLGLVCLDQQKWEEAGMHLEAALTTWRRLNNKYGEIQTILYLAKYELVRGYSHKASARLKDAKDRLGQYDRARRYHQLHELADELAKSGRNCG